MLRFLFLIAVSLVSLSASAQTPATTTFNMNAELMGMDGKTPIKDGHPTKEDPTCVRCSPITLGAVIEQVLVTTMPSDLPEPTAQGMPSKLSIGQIRQGSARIALAVRLHNNSEAVLDDDEIFALVKRIEIGYPGSLVAFRAISLLNPNYDNLKAKIEAPAP